MKNLEDVKELWEDTLDEGFIKDNDDDDKGKEVDSSQDRKDDHEDISEKSEEEDVDEDDGEEEPKESEYQSKHWFNKTDLKNPDGWTFKGKTEKFEKVIKQLKPIFSKKASRSIKGLRFRCKELERDNGDLKVNIGVKNKVRDRTDEKDDSIEEGIAQIFFYKKNAKGITSIKIGKVKNMERKLVTVLAKEIFKPIIDTLLEGKSLDKIIEAVIKGTTCDEC